MKRIAVLLADGFEEVEAVTPIDFLRRAGVEVIIAGVTGKIVTGAHGIKITADMGADELPSDLDGVVIPGGMPGAQNVSDSPVAVSIIQKHFNSGKVIAAICAAPAVVLGSHGLLKGRKYTCYPGYEKDVKDGTFCHESVVNDGNLLTSRGPGTAARFALALIERLAGKEEANKIHKGTLQQ